MDVTAYCDGSGNGFVCAMFDYGEGYQRTYFNRIDDQVFHEYRAILFAVELMEPGHKYTLYNDNVGAIQHTRGEKAPPTPIIKHLIQKIHKKIEHLDVEFHWMKREQNIAGIMLDTKARNIYTGPPPEVLKMKQREALKGEDHDVHATWSPLFSYEDRGSSNNQSWQQPPCSKCGGKIDHSGTCETCGFVPRSDKVRL